MTDSYVVITGASAGIGRSAAIAFAKRGKHLVLVARRTSELTTLKAEIHSFNPYLDVLIFSYDLAVSKNCYLLYETLTNLAIETWVNNAGFGNFDAVADQDLNKIENMLSVNVNALTILSTLFVREYQHIPNTQLINVSSSGGYSMIPNAITYCATKFFVSAFTEGLALELRNSHSPLQAKVLAPSVTETEFAMIANDLNAFSYPEKMKQYHTSQEMADFLLELYDSSATVAHVNRTSYQLELTDVRFNYPEKNN